MAQLPLLRFSPILRQYLWGGRRLAELGKPLGDGDHYAESWEIVDHREEQSLASGGSLAGTTLAELLRDHRTALLGRHPAHARFPLLFKYLDCQRTLSVQVHPNDEQAARLDPPDLGKTEAWYVLDARAGSKIYAGLKPGVDRQSLAHALASGDCERCLHQFEPRPGDCVFIEAGTVHALGAGLLVAEIQQSSDTTFRLFDWNRLDKDGKPRALHVDEALAVTDFARGPVAPQAPQPTDRAHVERLVESSKFVLDRWTLHSPQRLVNDDRFHILAVIAGNITAKGGQSKHRLQRGDTILVPACCSEVELSAESESVLLDMYLP